MAHEPILSAVAAALTRKGRYPALRKAEALRIRLARRTRGARARCAGASTAARASANGFADRRIAPNGLSTAGSFRGRNSLILWATAMSAGDKKDETTATKPAVPPESDREQKRNLAYLVVLAGVSAGEMFKLQKDKTIVGRGPAVGVRLNDEGVSREHCAFVREGDKMIVEDMGSTNGTFCNGIKIDRRELVDGDKIMVGSSTILKFTYHDYLDEVFQRQMYESALRDGLTKVFNKKYFTDYLEKEFAFAARHGGPLALIFLDIDYFKKINDTHGHPAGRLRARGAVADDDRRCCARRTCWRASAARSSRSSAAARTCRARGSSRSGVRKAVEERKFSFGGKDIPVTVSLGVVAMPDSGISEHNAFLAAADKALYEAKRSGRNRVCVARVREDAQRTAQAQQHRLRPESATRSPEPSSRRPRAEGSGLT